MSNDFLENYLTYCEGNEVPPSFHRWTGISALSTLVSRRVWMDFGIYQDHCNLYIVLVGKPADKKSTAMGIARKLIQQCDVKIAPASVTKQRIWELLDSKNEKFGYLDKFVHGEITYPIAAFPMFCNEMVTMLSAGGDPLGMIEFLTDIWDRPFYDTDTKTAGTNVIHGPYITILGCMTPDQTGSLMKQDIITGGFSRRCIIITPDRPAEPVPFPEITPLQAEAWANCIRIGNELKQVSGPFTYSDDAKTIYSRWYHANSAKQQELHPPAVLYFLGSLPRYVTQVSMLLALSKDRTSRVVDAETVSRAIAWLEPLKGNLGAVFAGSGTNPLSNVSAKIEAYLERAGRPLTRKAIHAALWDHADEKQFNDAFKFLTDSKRIVEISDCSGGSIQLTYRLPQAGSEARSDYTPVRRSVPEPGIDLRSMPSDHPPSQPVDTSETRTLGPPPLGA